MKWWVWYNPLSGQPAQVIQAASAADVKNKTGFPPLAGPFSTQADAEKWATTSKQGKSTQPAYPLGNIGSWGLKVSGITPYFVRGLKILFGGVLIILGIARLTGADDKLTAALGKVGPAFFAV